MSNVYIGGREIGNSLPPFIIAEMSGNHNQSLDRALQIVEAAAEAGAQGFKIQTYTPDTMTLNIDNGDFLIHDTKAYGKVNHFIIYIKKLIHHGSGINQFLIAV
ncbi:hypothetical protein AAHB52_30385 [Bacillus toyonensis]